MFISFNHNYLYNEKESVLYRKLTVSKNKVKRGVYGTLSK